MKTRWKVLVSGAIVILAIACRAGITESECFSAPLDKGRDNAVVTWGNICVPAGHFVVLRRGRAVAAFRFVSIRRPNPDLLVGCADYEIFERNDGVMTFREGYKVSRGRVSQLESHGLHPFVVQDGRWQIRADVANLTYEAPSCLALTKDVEYAATDISDVALIDAASPALQWLRLDPTMKRAPVTLQTQLR